jgi:uncharacterized membrane protein YagU involved in acid resistance/uncharacterized membrane protein
MPNQLRWPDAALAGLGSSMRTFAGPAMLAAHGRITGKPRIVVLAAAAGELAMDKSQKATDRTDLPAVVGRALAAAYTGREIAAVPGAAAGALSAVAGSYAWWRARGLVVATTGLPDPVVAVGEDFLAMGFAAIGARPDPSPADRPADGVPPTDGAQSADGPQPADGSAATPSRAHSLLRDLGVGAFAGVIGTAAMTIAQGAEFVLTDAEPSSSPAQVVDRLKRKAGRGRLKRRHRRVANQTMHWLYGTSWGVPYGVVAGHTKVAPELSGPVFGLLVWGAALAHEPALGLADVPWKRSFASLGSEAFFHLVYGIGAGAAVRALRNAR